MTFNDYVIPEGMKLYKEYCFLNIFKPFYSPPEFPSYDCSAHFVNENYSDTVVDSVFVNVSLETIGLSLLFIFAVGLFGGTIVELLYNKLDWFLIPLCNTVTKRYNYTIERNRLETMNGHP